MAGELSPTVMSHLSVLRDPVQVERHDSEAGPLGGVSA